MNLDARQWVYSVHLNHAMYGLLTDFKMRILSHIFQKFLLSEIDIQEQINTEKGDFTQQNGQTLPPYSCKYETFLC